MQDPILESGRGQKQMTYLKKGQHYDSVTSATARDAAAILGAIKTHLYEKNCNHTLREIVEEGLNSEKSASLINRRAVLTTSEEEENGI
jgi:hypothetical protein